MDLNRIAEAYTDGLKQATPGSREESYAVVVADHIHRFRKSFQASLADFRLVVRSERMGGEIEVNGPPHSSLLRAVEVAKAASPPHAVLMDLNEKVSVARVLKGDDVVWLQKGGPACGWVSLVAERKCATGMESPRDAEDDMLSEAQARALLEIMRQRGGA